MWRLSFLLILSAFGYCAPAQTRTVTLGIFTGITSSHTWDQGISKDARYRARYDIKFAPVGINYGIDYTNFGFVLSPGLINVGQHYFVVNTAGGHEGLRKIDLQYIQLPVALKFHLIDMSFLKVSAVGGISPAYLINGEEVVQHNATKLRFPPSLLPLDVPGYTEVYDGVLVPEMNRYVISSKNDFQSIQLFVQAGIRSDWELSEEWKVSFDFRVNYGVLEPRKAGYLQRLDAFETLYDVPGRRRDLFGQVNIGLSRYVDIEKTEKARKRQIKGTPKHVSPKKYPWPGPRKNRPRG
ncbi:MAG TPA: outer membrane beta-barrel protein [Ohtaekwangia sp.]|nr:outer membrane beta-barrel protein [Ohtaekwangia sp.]